MALELKASVCEGCNLFQFVDTTGLYNASTNPTGYGGFNGVLDPFDFDTYTLSVWYPGSDITSTPNYTYNLLTLPNPVPDAEDHYTWDITAAMMGVSVIKSGVWNFTATGVKDGLTYIVDVQCIFTNDIKEKLDNKLLDYDPTCECKSGCEDPLELFAMLTTVECGGICDSDKAQAIISQLYQRVPNCCS